MSDEGRKWIVKDGEGRIYGPFNTSKILRQIDKGYFAGGELVALYPGGNWIPISKAPEFYDRLLDVLAANPGEAARSNESGMPRTGTEGNSPVNKTDSLSQRGERGRVVRETAEDKIDSAAPAMPPMQTVPQVEEIKEKSPVEKGASTESVIELTDLKSLVRKERVKSAKLPLFLIAIAICLVVVAIVVQPKSNSGRIHLMAPRKGQPELSVEQAKEKFRFGQLAFQQDTYSGYQKAQDFFLQVIEGAPKNMYGYEALCLVYRELWPYTAQETRDLNVINQVAQDAKRVAPTRDVGGMDEQQAVKKLESNNAKAAVCEIVSLLAGNRFREARGLVDTWKEVQPDVPALHDFKAAFLEEDRNLPEAVNYAATVNTLWPQWLKPYVAKARILAKMRKFPEAMQIYQGVLKANPRHQVARVQLALLELNQFRQFDKSFEMLRTALDADDRIPRDVEFEANLGLAQIYQKRNQIGKALEYAKRALSLNTDHPDARRLVMILGGADDLKVKVKDGREMLFLGDQYARAGDCFAAQAEYKAAFESDMKNSTAAVRAAKCLWQLNQSAEAIEWLKKAIQADPKMTLAYITLSDYYSQRYDYLSAVRALQKIQQLAPRSFEVWRGYAQIEKRRNNFKGAIQYAKKAIELYEADAETYLILAEAQAGMGSFPEAFRSAERALELESSNVEAQIAKTRILVDLKGIDSALQYIDSLIEHYQQIHEYRVTKGEILLKEERYADAIAALNEAKSLEPTNKETIMLLGKAYRAQGATAEALQAFFSAAELDPSDANPVYEAGLLYVHEQKYPDAARQLQRVLKINPRFPRAHYQLGLAYLKSNSAAEALQESELERAINPELADAYLLGAEAYYAMKQYTNCASHYQQAVARRAASTDVYVKMARCYRLSGALDSAVSLLRQAKEKESGNADVYKELGATYHMRGLAAEAIEAFTKYLALAPNAPDRAEVEQLMRKIESGDEK